MRDRMRGGSIRRWLGAGEDVVERRRKRRPRLEGLEPRELLVASLEPIASLTVPADLGRVIPLDGGADAQRFTATSDNPDVQVAVINGPFLSIDVSHASSGPGDPAFSGTMTFQLFEELTPITVRRILALVNQGFYTSPTQNPDPSFTNLPSKNFHRVASGFPGDQFIVQGGSVNGNGTGEINQPGFPFQDEFRAPLVFTGQGQLAMANAGDDTNSSQFFVTTGMPAFLDFNHTIFGQLVDGSGVVSQMTQVSRNNLDVPVSPILITGTRVGRTSPDGALLIDTTAADAGESATITVTATDSSSNSTDTETFRVDVVPNTENQRPFLGPIGDQVTPPGQAVQFQLTAVSTNPGEQLTFAVGGGTSAQGTFAPVQNATATVDATGRVTVTPNAGFEGTIDLLVGVRDGVDRSGSSLDAVSNFDTQRITLTVTTNNRPTATPVTAQASQNQAVTIQLAGNTNDPDSQQTLVFELTGPPVNGQVSNFNSQDGTLTYTPNTNFSGEDVLTFRVTDVGAPTPNLSSEPATVTVQVSGGDMVNVPPTAQPQSLNVQANTPTPVQLVGMTGDPDSGQTLTYILDTSQTRGTVSDFNADTGTFTYTPPGNFIGSDSLSFRVRDVGPPTPNLESQPATVMFNVIGAVDTGAVRQIGTTLIVSPTPGRLIRPSRNTIDVALVDGRVSVSINGQIDQLRPVATDLERLIVYGAKAGDSITVAPDVPLLTTLDGGLGGVNNVQAGDLPSRLHGWFGRNTLQGGASRDALIGRLGHVRFRPSAGDDLLFAGDPDRFPSLGDHAQAGQGDPPTGQFFRFVNNRLVPVPTPPAVSTGRLVLAPPESLPPEPLPPEASQLSTSSTVAARGQSAISAAARAASQQSRADRVQQARDRLGRS